MPFPPIVIIPFPGDFVSKHAVGLAVLVVFRIFLPFPPFPFPFPGDLVLLLKQNVGALDIVGSAEGVILGVVLGCAEGLKLGCAEGVTLGVVLGCAEGLKLGCAEGLKLGCIEGLKLGCAEGLALGCIEGLKLGCTEGLALGVPEGLKLGWVEGLGLLEGLELGLSVGHGVPLLLPTFHTKAASNPLLVLPSMSYS